jgi:hypothetical protein
LLGDLPLATLLTIRKQERDSFVSYRSALERARVDPADDGLGERYGYIDNFGTEVIPPSFEDARAFSEGLAAVKIGGKWGYLAPDGGQNLGPPHASLRSQLRS